MNKAMLMVPAFAGTFVLGRSFGQEVQTFCDDCESTYVSAEEFVEYLEVASADQQVRSLDIGKAQVQVAISHRGRLEQPGGVAEHDLVTEPPVRSQQVTVGVTRHAQQLKRRLPLSLALERVR